MPYRDLTAAPLYNVYGTIRPLPQAEPAWMVGSVTTR